MKLTTFIIAIIFSLTVKGQTKEIAEQIKQVENNLIPFVPVKGFKGWNIEERMRYYNVPAVSIAVIKDYKIVWAKAYGLADTMSKIKATTETMFSAGSISKFIAAVTALNLVAENKLALDKPINDYLTSWKIPTNDITKKTPTTLRMLLSHTGGTTQSAYFGFTPDKNPLPTIVEILNGAEISESRPVVVNSEPNKEFRYSGGGTIIAQLAMMDVSKKSFASLTQEKIFDKLDMKNSTFVQPVPAKYNGKTAWAYSSASWFKGMPYVYPQQAAAGLYSTPTDLAKFFIDVQKSYLGKGKLLNKNLTMQMLTPQMNVSDGSYKEEIGVGPFLFQRTDNTESKGKYFEFTGVNAGFLAYGMASVEAGNGVVIMLNSGDDVNGLGKELRRAVAKVYNWYKFLPEEINPIVLDKNILQAYEGRYRKGADEVVVIRKEKDYLVEKINQGNEIYCFPIKKDSIIFTDYNIEGYFDRNEKGEVISLRTKYQTPSQAWMKMKDDEFTASEYLLAKKYDNAKEAFTKMNMNEYQISYLAYDLLNKKTPDLTAVITVLSVAEEQHPTSSIVYSRWGDYYLKISDKIKAISSYKKAYELDPTDKVVKETLDKLQQ
jgi:CubicO group peptidase (beta-lactamase class C family)